MKLPTNAEAVLQRNAALNAFLTADKTEAMEAAYYALDKSNVLTETFGILAIHPMLTCATLGKTQHLAFYLKHHKPPPPILHDALVKAIRGGNEESIAILLNDETVWEHVSDNDNLALITAAESGKITILNRLLQCRKVVENIAVESNSALVVAAEAGHLPIVNRLLDFEDVQNNLLADHNNALCVAVENGHLNIVNRLLEFETIQSNLATDQFRLLSTAMRSRQPEVINRLLEFPKLLNHAELCEQRYGTYYTHSFIDHKLNALQQRIQSFQSSHPDGVFDIEETEVPLYFCVLRSLIRRGVHALDRAVHLLMIPTLTARLHQAINGGPENELLRLAIRVHNRPAELALMQLPSVRALAIQRAREHRDRESSLVALSENETRMLEAAKAFYEPEIQRLGGIKKVFLDFKAYLKQQYEDHPATYTVLDETHRLPLGWEAFQALQLCPEHYQLALNAYYQHNIHTAFRYLSKPNPWMDQNAKYVLKDELRPGLYYAYFEYYIPLIACLWLAAKDPHTPTINDFVLEDRIQLFIHQIALIGRQHNWDETRPKTDREGRPVLDAHGLLVQEEFDNLKADRPSCYGGMNRPLFQSVLGHPLFSDLNSQCIKQELNEMIREYFKALFDNKSAEEKTRINQLLADVFYNTEKPTPLLCALNISSSQKQAWVNTLHEKYGARFDDSPQFLRLINDLLSLAADETHITKFYQSLQLNLLLGPLPEPSALETEATKNSNESPSRENSFLLQTSFFSASNYTQGNQNHEKSPDPDRSQHPSFSNCS